MSYNILLTNGSSLTAVADGTVDTTTTNLGLVGRNYAGYGGILNENFIKLLENSSNATSPANPLVGQLWWDSTSRHLNVWQGTGWKVISSSMTGPAAPTFPVTGDFWWNTSIGQFSVYNGTQWVGIGPAVLPGTALTAIAAYLVSDGSTTHYVGNVIVNNKLSAVFSTDTTSFNPVTPVGGLTTINPGLNMVANAAITGGNVSITNTATINNATVGNLNITGAVNFPVGSLFTGVESDFTPAANLTYNLGSTSLWWNNIYGTSIHAQYADLAERFETDVAYEPGTVVELGGVAEITAAVEELSEDVFGVISTKAAFVMNGTAGTDETHPPVAVQGRVPVKVIGKIRKGDRLVSAGNGLARAGAKKEITTWNVIGRSLENKTTDGTGVVEAVVKLNS